jgi:hypothetical protein
VPSDAGQYRFVRVVRVLIFPGAPELCWFCVACKTAGHPPLPGHRSEPAVPTWVHGTNRGDPALLSPDGAPVRWLLMDGYVYDIRDTQDHPPWQEGRWASMNGVRRPGAKRSPARWTRYDTRREAQDAPGV